MHTKLHGCLVAIVLSLGLTFPVYAGDKDEGFAPLFDGHSLNGWVNVNGAPNTFYVKDGQIITTGRPTGYLRTAKQYENFIAEFDWMHVPPAPGAIGNSGFFVWADPLPAVGTGYTRGIEVQVLVNLTYKNKKGKTIATSQGDLFGIWGASCVPDRPHPDGWARCLPSGNFCKGANEWNHYRIEATNGVIKLAVNGHVVSGLSHCKPRKGYLALESEGSECHFKNLKIKQLPSTHPTKDECADLAEGYKNLYTGLDLSGWKLAGSARKHWQPRDNILHYSGNGRADDSLRTARALRPAALMVDFRFPTKADKPCSFVVYDGGKEGHLRITISPNGRLELDCKEAVYQELSRIRYGRSRAAAHSSLKPPGQWNRMQIMQSGATFRVAINGKVVRELHTGVSPAKG